MIVVLLLLLFLIIYKSKLKLLGTFEDYVSKDKTLPIKGIFVLICSLSLVLFVQ